MTANPVVDLSINKTVSSNSSYVGENITYTIVVVNNGPSTATNVTVTDKLSPLVKYLDSNSTVGTKFNDGNNAWFVGNLAKGENATLTIVVKVIGNGTVVNSAFVRSNENDTDDSNNNASSDNVTAKPDVKLNVTKELIISGLVYAGDNVTYVIVITNNGVSEATGVKVTDTVSGDGVVVKCVDQDGKVYSGSDWVVDSVAVGKNVTLTVIVHVLADGTIANGVVVSAEENDTNVSVETPGVPVYPDVRLNVTKELIISGLVYAGDNVTYVIVITNECSE